MARRARAAAAPEPPYGALLEGVLRFADLESGEETLRRLEELRQRFAALGDKRGVAYCRQMARRGRARAEAILRNPKVDSRKRREKRELAEWFRIWLEAPEIFPSWLELRKSTPEYRELRAAVGPGPANASDNGD